MNAKLTAAQLGFLPTEAVSINGVASDGLRLAMLAELEGLATVSFHHSHTQQYSRYCQTEYWYTYTITLTDAGRAALDAGRGEGAGE